jgi:uncharacterized protein YegJ (DUF2314 family)
MIKNDKRSPISLTSWICLVLGILLLVRGVRMVGSHRWDLWLGFQFVLGFYLVGCWFFDWRKRNRETLPPTQQGISGGGAIAHSQETDDDSKPLQSLVFLLDSPRNVSDAAWIDHLGQALGVNLRSDDKDAQEFILPMPHPALTPQGDDCFMLKIPSGVFWILNVKRPYFDDVEGWAARVSDRRMRDAVAGHRAWISVDLVSWLDGPPDHTRIYDVLGKILAALAGPDVRVVFSPELGRANEFDPMLLPRLSGGDPLGLFEDPTFAPVLQAPSDDEQMEAAIAEARARWPEFVAAFNQHDPASGRPFIVKAPFTSGGETEHMWFLVTGLERHMIHGTLANHPHRLMDFHEGQAVSVEASKLSDWVCADANDVPLGGWTQKVLNARQSRSK